MNKEFEALLDFLKRMRGFDFTGYKRASLIRRADKRLQAVGLEGFADYVDYLEVHPEEFAYLFNTLLINVTAFFRDAPAWEHLSKEVIPRIVEGKGADDPIRAWSAGCASGEEAYTVVIALAEAIGMEQFRKRVKIYATDIDEEALAQARQAAYRPEDLKAISPDVRERYFEAANGRYVFHNDLRRSVIFGLHDLVQDAPISRLDLLVCRNTLMYFNAEAQARILARLHFALNDRGFLFLGKAEMLLTHANLFTPETLRHRVFRKSAMTNVRDRLLALAHTGNEEAGNRLAQQVRLRDRAFDTAPAPQIVVDLNNNLAMVNQQACAMFGLSARDIGRRFSDLEVSYRPVELRSCIEQAHAERRVVSLRDVERSLPNGEVQRLDVEVTPLMDNGGGVLGVSIAFNDTTAHHRLRTELEHANEELQSTNEELQSASEELETTNEELQSTNEELEPTNEELQSSNEELETTNEELQSTNEELETINEELRHRTDELNRVNLYLESILGSLRIGVVVLDRDLNVSIWNPRAGDLWGLLPSEVEGRALLNLDIGLPVGQLRDLILSCLERKAEHDELMLNAVNRRGKAIRCRVTCVPLADSDGEIRGVVLLMEEWEGEGREG